MLRSIGEAIYCRNAMPTAFDDRSPFAKAVMDGPSGCARSCQNPPSSKGLRCILKKEPPQSDGSSKTNYNKKLPLDANTGLDDRLIEVAGRSGTEVDLHIFIDTTCVVQRHASLTFKMSGTQIKRLCHSR